MKFFLLLATLLSTVLFQPLTSTAQKPTPKAVNHKANAAALAQEDHSGFVENKGQLRDQNGKSNAAVKYLLNMPGLNVQLRGTGFSYDAWIDEDKKQSNGNDQKVAEKADAFTQKFHRVDIDLEGANSDAIMIAGQPLTEVSNIINEHGAFEGIRSFQKITYRNIYRGIDLEFVAKKGTDKPVEYNFIVHPGADASQIKLKYNSGSDISLKNGMIEMDLAFGVLKEKIPASFTQQDGKALAVRYMATDELKNVYAFHVPDYDKRKTLVIDPTPSLVWSTYYGGSGTLTESIFSIDVDDAGNIYIGGTTNSTASIATAGTHQATNAGGSQYMYVAKLTAAGVRLWGTYYGGATTSGGTTAIQSFGRLKTYGTSLYFNGYTTAAGLASAGAYQTAVQGNQDIILVRLNGVNGTRMWATYYGGNAASGSEAPYTLALDAAGNAYFGGETESTSGIASAGAYQTVRSGTTDGFLAKFNASGGRVWSTYIGGPGTFDDVFGTAVDASGNVYVSGYTTSTSGITTAGSFQPAFAGGTYDMYLIKLNSTGSTKIWGTYWGGDLGELNRGLILGPDGNLVMGGMTGQLSNPEMSNGLASTGTYQTAPVGARDLLFAKFTPGGDRLWATYYGGTASEFLGPDGFDLDESGNILFTGDGLGRPTQPFNPPSSTLATNCSYQTDLKGNNDVFVGKLSADGTTRIWGTYFGGSGLDRGYTLAYAGNGNFLVGGMTQSNSGITTAGAHQTAMAGTSDGWLARFNEGLAPSDVKVTTTTLNPLSQTTCILGIPTTITGNAVSLYNPPGFSSPIFYQWQSAETATGPWSDMEGEVFKDLQPLASQTNKYYRRFILVNNGYCDKKAVDSSAVAEVLVNSDIAPIANADGPQWYVCGTGANTVTMSGSASGGSGVYSSYQWYAGSNLITPAFTGANYTPTVTATTTYTLKVTDNAGCVDVDQVTVTPAVANAGPDVSYCQTGGGVQIGTTGIPGGAVSYAWSTVSGSAAATSLSCTDCAQPVANPTATTTYRLTTTVTRKGGATCVTTDDVIVTFVAAPTGGASFGGTDKTICKGSTVVLGGVNDAAATYSWSPTSYLSASNIFNPTFNAGTNSVKCPMVYTVTATKGGCTFTDQVNVSVVDPSTSLDNQTLNCEGWSSGNTNNCNGATYTWQLASGPGVVPTGASLRNGGADAYLTNTGATDAVYRRVTTVNGVSCNSADITISPCAGGNPETACPPISIGMMSPQGCPKVFGEQELQLFVSGINAADYTFSWSPANLMSNPSAPSVTITSTAAATINVTVTNKYTGRVCTAPAFPINNPSWSLPVLNISDKSTCPGTDISIGEPAAAGYSYAWTPTLGLNSATIANPIATLATSSSFGVTKTDDANGCKATGTVNVLVQDINYDAGVDRAVCNGATVTLGTTPGGSYNYSWTPVDAAWTNGTGPTDAQPQVLFAGSSLTFNVTVTNPVTGCQKTDAVTLRGSTLPGEYAGAGPVPALCPGGTFQLGRAAEPNATYSWSPATGLSCTNCADPVATAGNANQAYTVEVSYPGCTTPVTDNATLTVNSLPNVVLTDKTVCPTTPTNIGIGGTGNTASLADVAKYEWSPATGLSCTNCASPNANPVAVTTYKVVITFDNGCTLEREVTVTPSVTATAKPDATVCPGGSVVLGSPATPNVTYAWSVLSGTAGSVTPTNSAQPTANPAVTTVYRLTATGTGPKSGCTVTDDVQIVVKALPALTITGNAAVCAGGTASLSVTTVTPNIIYQWSPSTGVASPDSSSTTIQPIATTTYRLTQTDLNSGCSDYKEVVVAVHPNNVSATGGSISVCPASSATIPLTVSPASGNTIVWSPATYLNNPYAQNPVITPQADGNYIATVTNNTTNCSDTALVIVSVPASCLGSDFGDAPSVYENGNAANHGIVANLKIGAAIDAEGTPESAALSAPATGDDGNSQINDEEGISFLPTPNTASKSVGLMINNVLNNTGTTAYLVAWIDFNRDGDFDDAGERSAITSLASGSASVDPVLRFDGFNQGCLVKGGPSYLRVRLTTDLSEDWSSNPSPIGARANGEVEDYSIVITGTDFGDAPVLYPIARAQVNPDLNEDGKPDDAGSVWLGAIVDYPGCATLPSMLADGDDKNAITDDEDGLNTNGKITPNTTKDWDIIVNSQGPVNDVQWGLWIDWNADGSFDDFYNGSVNTASPVTVPVSVTAPDNMVSAYIARLGVKAGAAFASSDYDYPVTNGEWEDYIGPQTALSATLISFTAAKKDKTALLRWETSSEENSAYFVVERSSNGSDWKEAGRTKAAGNSSVHHSYSLTDQHPIRGMNYYRLKMVDIDGQFSVSKINRLDFAEQTNHVGLFPNPAYNTTRLVFDKAPGGIIAVTILNNKGQNMSSHYLNGALSTHTLNVQHLAQGVYYVTVKGIGISQNIKLVVQ